MSSQVQPIYVPNDPTTFTKLSQKPVINLTERVENYRKSDQGSRYPDSIPIVGSSGRWLSGTWILGNNYHATSPLYGAYPPRYLERVLALHPDWSERRIMHAFSGSVPRGDWTRVDMRSDRTPTPDVVADLQKMPIPDDSFDLIIADPPYSADDALRYGTPMMSRRRVLSELARVCPPGGQLVWLDTQLPQFRKSQWHWWGAITVIRSTNHRIRLAALFTRSTDAVVAEPSPIVAHEIGS